MNMKANRPAAGLAVAVDCNGSDPGVSVFWRLSRSNRFFDFRNHCLDTVGLNVYVIATNEVIPTPGKLGREILRKADVNSQWHGLTDLFFGGTHTTPAPRVPFFRDLMVLDSDGQISDFHETEVEIYCTRLRMRSRVAVLIHLDNNHWSQQNV
jgi:hypothetical protein